MLMLNQKLHMPHIDVWGCTSMERHANQGLCRGRKRVENGQQRTNPYCLFMSILPEELCLAFQLFRMASYEGGRLARVLLSEGTLFALQRTVSLRRWTAAPPACPRYNSRFAIQGHNWHLAERLISPLQCSRQVHGPRNLC
jgi:hypothetical protein